MKWALRIARLAGIDVRVHATFLLLLAWVAFVEYKAGNDIFGALIGVVFVIAVFATVVFHEMAHALVAKKYGVETREIILLPIGGVSRLAHMPEDPRREFWIAIAGPLASLGIAAVLFLVVWGASMVVLPSEGWPVANKFVYRLAWVNVALAVFNLIPAFPMDGGRVLRSLLATRIPYPKATSYAARLGQGVAALLGLVGLFWSPILLLIAVFVWLGASQEEAEAQIRAGLSGVSVSRAMVTDFRTISPGDPLSHATELMLSGSQSDFPVVHDGVVSGVLTRRGLLRGLSERGPGELVETAMDHDFATADPEEMLADVLPRLRDRACQSIPVIKESRLLGLLTPEHISDYLAIQSAESQAPADPRPRPAA